MGNDNYIDEVSPEQQRGIIVGFSVNISPPPPARHILNEPVKVPQLPIHQLPTISERLTQKLRNFVNWVFTGRSVYNEEDVKKAYDAIIMIIVASVPYPSQTIKGLISRNQHLKKQWRRFKKIGVRVKENKHPYDLFPVFDIMPRLRGPLLGEKYIIELYCSILLNEYLKLIRVQSAENKVSIEAKFTFAGESVQYFRDGHNIEQQLDKITHPRERLSALKLIYENYYHAKWYYIFSVLSREPTIDDGKLFMRAYHAMFFMARIGDAGAILREPQRNLLPKQSLVKFIARRDNSVRKRVSSDEVFAKTITDILKYLPSR